MITRRVFNALRKGDAVLIGRRWRLVLEGPADKPARMNTYIEFAKLATGRFGYRGCVTYMSSDVREKIRATKRPTDAERAAMERAERRHVRNLGYRPKYKRERGEPVVCSWGVLRPRDA